MDYWYPENWLVEEFVNDIGLKVKDTIKESRDVLLVRRIQDMIACNVHVVELILEVKEKVNEKKCPLLQEAIKDEIKEQGHTRSNV